MKLSYAWSMSSIWTFDIKPIRALINRYLVNAKNVIVPFAGKYRFKRDGITYIDIEGGLPEPYIKGDCIDVLQSEPIKSMRFDLGLIDPPYTMFQSVHSYGNEKMQDVSIVKNLVAGVLCDGAYTITFGFNSSGFGTKRGFKKIELLLVGSGGSHNDIICLVERKLPSLDTYIGDTE